MNRWVKDIKEENVIDDSDLVEELIDSEVKYTGNMLVIKDDLVKLPNGNQSRRDVVLHPGAICVLPITKDNKVVLVDQFRYPVNQVLTEAPAGKFDSFDDEPIDTVLRELREETGYSTSIEDIELVGQYLPVPGYSDEVIYLYIAKNCYKVSEQDTDEDEFIRINEVSVEELKSKKIFDMKTELLIAKFKEQL